MTDYRLTYFDIKGLAEPIRLLFAYVQVPYEDIRIPYDPTPTAVLAELIPPQVQKKLPYGTMPILEFGDMILSDSQTIGRYLARKYGLMGANEMEAAKIDEILDARCDYGNAFKAARLAKNGEEREAALTHIRETAAPKYLGKFSQILKENGGQYFVGSSASWADIQMLHWLTYIGHKLHDEHFIKEYPVLEAFVQKMESIPQIQKWIRERPDTKF